MRRNWRLEKMKMNDGKDQDLRDLRAEATTRGKKRPKKKRYRSPADARLPNFLECFRIRVATGKLIWKLFAGPGGSRNLTSCVNSSLCRGSAAETTDDHSMRGSNTAVLLLRGKGCKMAGNNSREFLAEFPGGNLSLR
jgi:hypothetical protein